METMETMERVVHKAAYWQTFTNPINFSNYDCVILAAIHFGVEADGQVYMHLNDKAINEHRGVLDQLAREKGYRNQFCVGLMIGGAGGGWDTIRDNFVQCVSLLREFTTHDDLVDFLDLDPEVPDDVDSDTVLRFMRAMDHLTFTAAPISLPTTFWNSIRARETIRVWHLQTYDPTAWSSDTVDALARDGWPIEKISFGYTSGTFSSEKQKNDAISIVTACGIKSIIIWDPVS